MRVFFFEYTKNLIQKTFGFDSKLLRNDKILFFFFDEEIENKNSIRNLEEVMINFCSETLDSSKNFDY